MSSDALTDVSERGWPLWVAQSDLRVGDEVSITFDNSFDRRFSETTTVRGPVTHCDHETDSPSTVVLSLDGPDKEVSITHGRGAFVKKPGNRKGTNVGRVVAHERHTNTNSNTDDDGDANAR